ncbi:MAG: hypothetical protein IAE80_19525 [Anaerolinea sp.]|nr:hypothetical protein [Anaerolinea sp.]
MRRPVDPQLEVIGSSILGIVQNIQQDEIRPFILKHRLHEVDPETWYPLTSFLGVLNEIGEAPGGMSNLVAVGMAQIDSLAQDLPPEMKGAPLITFFHLWDTLYHQIHRNGEIGSVKAEQVSPRHIRTVHDHFYPDDLSYGVAYGLTKHFLIPKSHFIVSYDPHTKRMDEGGDLTIIDIKWEG